MVDAFERKNCFVLRCGASGIVYMNLKKTTMRKFQLKRHLHLRQAQRPRTILRHVVEESRKGTRKVCV